VRTSPFFEKAPTPTRHKHKVTHAAVRPGGLTAHCVQSTPVCKSTITWCWYSTIWRSCGCQSSVARALAPGQTRQGSHSRCKKKKKSPNPMQSQAHAAVRPGGLTARCVQSAPVFASPPSTSAVRGTAIIVWHGWFARGGKLACPGVLGGKKLHFSKVQERFSEQACAPTSHHLPRTQPFRIRILRYFEEWLFTLMESDPQIFRGTRRARF
jgi:hypothetical protein